MSNVPCFSRRIVLSITALSVFSLLSTSTQAEGIGKGEAINIGLFEAMDAGHVDVKFIPRDAKQANVLVKNLTDKPLEIRLPKTFASVPVLGQGMGMGGMGMGGGGMGMGGGGGMMGGGFMRVPPERMKKIAVNTVCLEHGKKDPNPKVAYKIIPLEQFTDDPQIKIVCEALGYHQITQNTAQAAAWHIMDEMSWQDLAKKNRVESRYVGNIPWFSAIELRTAAAVVQEAARRVKQQAERSPSEADYQTTEADYEG